MDWGPIIVAAIVGLPATIGSVAALLASLRNGRKIDDNTDVTKKSANVIGTRMAISDDKQNDISNTLDAVQKQTNGDRTREIAEAVARVVAIHSEEIVKNSERITRHAKANEEHLEALRVEFAKLKETLLNKKE